MLYHNTQTMAVEITQDIWPIATAILAGGFSQLPFSQVEGKYLVINEPTARTFKKTGTRPIIVIENSWMNAKMFRNNYEFVDFEVANTFRAVYKK